MIAPGAGLLLLDLLQFRLGARERAFIERLNGLIHPVTGDRDAFLFLFRDAARLLPPEPLALRPSERTLPHAALVAHWTLDELARVVLLLIASAYLVPADRDALLYDCAKLDPLAVDRALPLLG